MEGRVAAAPVNSIAVRQAGLPRADLRLVVVGSGPRGDRACDARTVPYRVGGAAGDRRSAPGAPAGGGRRPTPRRSSCRKGDGRTHIFDFVASTGRCRFEVLRSLRLDVLPRRHVAGPGRDSRSWTPRRLRVNGGHGPWPGQDVRRDRQPGPPQRRAEYLAERTVAGPGRSARVAAGPESGSAARLPPRISLGAVRCDARVRTCRTRWVSRMGRTPPAVLAVGFVHNRLLTPMVLDMAAFVGLHALIRKGRRRGHGARIPTGRTWISAPRRTRCPSPRRADRAGPSEPT